MGVIRQRLSFLVFMMKKTEAFICSSVRRVLSGCIQSDTSVVHFLSEASILEECSLHHQIHLSPEKIFQIFLQTEVAVEEVRRLSPLERHNEVEIAKDGIKLLCNSRSEEV